MNPRPSVFPIRPLGRVVSAAEASLYSDALTARAAVQIAGQKFQQEMMDEAAAKREITLQNLRVQAAIAAAAAEASFAAETANTIAGLETAISDAIATGVERVVGSLDLDEAIARAAKIAIATLQDRVKITIRVAPDRLMGVRAAFEPSSGGLTVVGDPALGGTDCVIQTRGGFVRAGLDGQLEALRQAFAAAIRS